MKRATSLVFAAVAAGLVFASYGGTLTWNGGTSGTWDTSTANWLDESNATVAWVNGSSATFKNTSALTISVSGAIFAADITGTETGNMTFNGSGTLAWSGWFGSNGHVYFDCVLADDIDGAHHGLHFNSNGHVYLRNAGNRQTGGTYFKNTRSSLRAFAVNAGDGALGPIPATAQDNLVAQGGNVALFVDASYSVAIDAKRRIRIADGQTLLLSPNGKLRIQGTITGENASGTAYPTGTRVTAHNQWGGLATLDPGDGNQNYFGRLYVPARLEIASGTTKLITLSIGTGENAPLYVRGNASAYSETRGYLFVSGGTVQNDQNRYFQIDNYGHVDIAGGTVALGSGEYLNALQTPGKTTIRDGGMLNANLVRVSQTAAGNGGEIFLGEGGILRTKSMRLDYNTTPTGIVHFNGGHLQSRDGNNGTPVVDSPTNAKWDGIEFRVEAGGAVFDTSYGHHVWFGRPLVSGVSTGETDGGLTCILANGKAVVLTDGIANSTYNGPVRLVKHGSQTSSTRTLQCRVPNAIPVGATLQIDADCQAGFNEWQGDKNDLAQTVARVEGLGRIFNNSLFAVTEAVAPVFDGAYGTLSFEKPCSLSGDFEIKGDADGCACVKFEQAGQSISGLALKVADISAFSKTAPKSRYKILDAPNGYSGTFALGNVSGPWVVKYTPTAAYLHYVRGTMFTVR